MRRLTRITNGSRTKNLRRGDKDVETVSLNPRKHLCQDFIDLCFCDRPFAFFHISDLDANFIQSMKTELNKIPYLLSNRVIALPFQMFRLTIRSSRPHVASTLVEILVDQF